MDNQSYLKEAGAHVEEFESQLEPERLREACQALENISLGAERDGGSRARLRAASLSLWLHLLQLLDRYRDPHFDPKDVPQKLVEPPPVPGGIVLRPGSDPALIDDPTVRADYQKAIAANRMKADRYRLQIQLGRLEERIGPRAEAFIRNAYGATARDRQEARTAIETLISNPRRLAGLVQLLTSLQPDER